MVDSGDTAVLSAEALVDPAVVAALALCSFRGASRPDEPAPTPTAAVDLPPAWGCHALRSERWIRDYTEIRLLSNSKDATAPKRRLSPVTPLEHRGGSGASESCSEEILGKRSDTGGVPGGPAVPERKGVVSGERELSEFRISGSKRIRRSPAKKKLTLPELEAMHQSLLEHRKFILKELETKRRSKEALVAKNREFKELKLGLESRKRANTAPMPEEVHPKRVRLPDLNMPLVLNSDRQLHTVSLGVGLTAVYSSLDLFRLGVGLTTAYSSLDLFRQGVLGAHFLKTSSVHTRQPLC